MIRRNMAMKSYIIGLVLLLSIITHTSAKNLIIVQSELSDVVQELSKQVKELRNQLQLKTGTVNDDSETPNLFEVNVKEGTGGVTDGTDNTFEDGDIILTPDQIKIQQFDNNPNIQLDAIRSIAQRWPKSSDGRVRIPLIIDSAIRGSTRKMNAIRQAISEYKQFSCIDWVETTNTANHYVKIINDRGCYSYIGKITNLRGSNGFQPVSIGNGCGFKGTVEHEFLHALGFFHEQSRPDRDDHVKIQLENLSNPALQIISGKKMH